MNFSLSFLTFNFSYLTEYVASMEYVINARTDKKVTLVVQVCLYVRKKFFYRITMLFKLGKHIQNKSEPSAPPIKREAAPCFVY